MEIFVQTSQNTFWLEQTKKKITKIVIFSVWTIEVWTSQIYDNA